MATIREYYEKDFSHSARLHIKLPHGPEQIEGALLYDFTGFSAFLALYISGKNKTIDYFATLLKSLAYGQSQIVLDGKVTLPSAKLFPGALRIENKTDFEILARFLGDNEWISTKDIQASRRVFIYSETDLLPPEIDRLKSEAKKAGHELQFRADRFREERSKAERPLAFICHDSRDKDIARKIAIGLQKMLCPVWYDEFSLKIGDDLRGSIENGLKGCKKCVLVLSPNFLSNKGWTKTEFDSIFTRQILEEDKLVLPVWSKVGKHDVYDYCPSLLNVKGADFEALGEEVSPTIT